jgi:arginine N-succinyltransferase
LPPEVQSQIGQVGEETRGVRKMLETIGFTYSERIDPFDGGPHFEALTEDVTLIKEARLCMVADEALPEDLAALSAEVPEEAGTQRVLIGSGQAEGACNFRAIATRVKSHGGEVALSGKARQALKVSRGANVWTIPY